MLDIQENADLSKLNTLALQSTARFLATVDHESDLQQVLQSKLAQQYPVFMLSGGSNILLSTYLNALVIRPLLKGIHLIRQDSQSVWVEVMAGEEWHPFVQYAIAQGWYGLENLSLIPGFVGASPIQNIGAYGVEVSQLIDCIKAWHIPSQTWQILTPAECAFGYRDSIFKQQSGDWVISCLTFKLLKQPQLMLSYGDVKQQAGENPTPQSVANAIITIRQNKLPDPKQIANVGSFFKNPVVSSSQFAQLKVNHPAISGYSQADGDVKVAAGWLIDQAGWKGRQIGPVGMYAKQALVLVNHGVASLTDVNQLSQAVQDSVFQQFGIKLEQEPVLVTF